ncbi:HNH endonuclease [Arcanobacterium haemolyticum]
MADPRSTRRWKQLRQAYKNQKAPCAICGQPIDYEAPAGTPQSFELDHIKPLALDPNLAYETANLQATHKICNNRKNNRQNTPTLGQPSRTW